MMWFAVLCVSFISLWTVNEGVGLVLCKSNHFYMDERSRRLTAVEFGPGGIVNCEDFGELTTWQTMYINIPLICLTKVNKDGMASVMKNCPQIEQSRLLSSALLDQMG